MTAPASADVLPGPDGTLVLRPAQNASLRSLAASLRLAGIRANADPTSRTLTLLATPLEELRSALRGWTLHVPKAVATAVERRGGREVARRRAQEVCRRLVQNPNAAANELCDYAEIATLDLHQIAAVAIASHPEVNGFCIFDEQGLGKTVEALFAFDRLRQTGLVERALVLAPKNMVLEWLHDLNRFFPGRYHSVAVTGDERAKRAALDRNADLFVTNFETATRLGGRLREALGVEGLLIIDESFFVKNSEALRTQAVKRLRDHAARCIVLCGTPAPNSAVDLVEQFNIADGGAAFAGIAIPDDPLAARDLVRRVVTQRGVYLRRLKGQVLDLPDRTFTRVVVPLQPQQQQIYHSAVTTLVEEARSVDEVGFQRRVAHFSARRMALLQACSNPAALDSNYRETPAKLLALDSILEDLISQRGEKVLVWSFFTKSLEAIVQRYGRFNPVRIDGTIPDVAMRREAVRRFQEDDDTLLFVGNPAAAGAGLTLHRARYAIYESFSNQAAHYLQSLDRIHRRGQTRSVEYLVLLGDGTIELREYDRILSKEANAQELLGDCVDPPTTREAFLADLLGAANRLA